MEESTSDTTDFVQTTHQDPRLAKLTLEMFMNNSYYTKYLSTADPYAYKEHQGFLDSLVQHRSSILDLTRQLLDHPETQITRPVLEAFRQYASACIKYIEHMELNRVEEERAEDGGGEREWSDGESDHEMLFEGGEGEGEGEPEPEPEPDLAPFPRSFWGPAVLKQRQPKRGRDQDMAEDLSGKSFWGDIRAFSNKRR